MWASSLPAYGRHYSKSIQPRCRNVAMSVKIVKSYKHGSPYDCGGRVGKTDLSLAHASQKWCVAAGKRRRGCETRSRVYICAKHVERLIVVAGRRDQRCSCSRPDAARIRPVDVVSMSIVCAVARDLESRHRKWLHVGFDKCEELQAWAPYVLSTSLVILSSSPCSQELLTHGWYIPRTYWPVAYHAIGTAELESLRQLGKLRKAIVVQQEPCEPGMNRLRRGDAAMWQKRWAPHIWLVALLVATPSRWWYFVRNQIPKCSSCVKPILLCFCFWIHMSVLLYNMTDTRSLPNDEPRPARLFSSQSVCHTF